METEAECCKIVTHLIFSVQGDDACLVRANDCLTRLDDVRVGLALELIGNQ